MVTPCGSHVVYSSSSTFGHMNWHWTEKIIMNMLQCCIFSSLYHSVNLPVRNFTYILCLEIIYLKFSCSSFFGAFTLISFTLHNCTLPHVISWERLQYEKKQTAVVALQSQRILTIMFGMCVYMINCMLVLVHILYTLFPLLTVQVPECPEKF